MKQKQKQLAFNLYDLHTMKLNERDSDIILVGDSYQDGEPIELMIVLNDLTFLKFISHHEIDVIKDNLKSFIDEL